MRALAAVAAFAGAALGQKDLQPKLQIVEESKLVHGSVSMDHGSPWCEEGQRMYWLVGHDFDDHPSCEVSPGVWEENRLVTLPLEADALNKQDDEIVDRHDCKTIYADDDDLLDIICMVGANIGKGYGYNELFLTQPDGSLKKVLKHGLQKYTTMRTRMMNVLHGPNGEQLVFISSHGAPRTDGKPNIHRMFRVTRGQEPYFEEVLHDNKDPWLKNTEATQVKIGDINGDGLDDIIVTNRQEDAMMFIQNKNDFTFTNVDMKGSHNWRAIRIVDMNGDGISDLVVTEGYQYNWGGPFPFRIFEGTGVAPYFDLNNPVFKLNLPFPSGDVEIMDVNGDGNKDIYVVQADEASDNYCGNPTAGGPPFSAQKWYGTGGFPPADFVAPIDKAPDLLLMGKPNYFTFDKVEMDHKMPGCGFLAERFGNDHTMILSHGGLARAGTNVLLTWPAPEASSAPSGVPSLLPSSAPSGVPSLAPSSVPSLAPSSVPSLAPSSGPTHPILPLDTSSPSLRPVQTATPDTEPFAPASSGTKLLSTGLAIGALMVFFGI